MANNRRIIENAASGERIVVVRTAAETGGELFAFELFLRPGAKVPAAHVHPEQQERFTVLEGRVRFRLGMRFRTALPGDRVTVTVGTSHSFANPGPRAAHLLVEVRPALHMEEALIAAAELPGAGRQRHRLSFPLRVALFLQEFDREVAVPLVPGALARLVVGPLAWVGRKCGLAARDHPRRGRS